MGRPVGRRRHRHQTVNKALDIGSHIINDARNMKPISSLSLYLLISSALYKCGMVFSIRTCNIYIHFIYSGLNAIMAFDLYSALSTIESMIFFNNCDLWRTGYGCL